jgi:hypothetical protein
MFDNSAPIRHRNMIFAAFLKNKDYYSECNALKQHCE